MLYNANVVPLVALHAATGSNCFARELRTTGTLWHVDYRAG